MSEEKKIPALRFSDFDGEWKLQKGGDFFLNSREKGEKGLPIYSVTIDRGMVRRDSLDRQMGANAADGTNLRAQQNDLVYNMMRMWQGAVGMALEECMVSPAYVVLTPKAKTYSEYFNQWFKSAKALYKLGAYSHGLTKDRLRLYYNDFAQIPMRHPLFEEQKEIAAFLGAVDEKIDQLRNKRDLLTDYKKGVMQQIFSQQIRFTREDGTPFPDWKEKRLGEVAGRKTEKNIDVDYTLVLTNSATKGIINQQDYFKKDIANLDNLSGYYIVEVGDFIYNPRISTSAPVGPIKKNKLCVGVMSPLYTVFRFYQEKTSFFEHYFETSFWHRYMGSVANYGARHDRMNITNADFLNVPLPLPHADEQQKIADFLTVLDDKISAVSIQLEHMQTFKQGLLQQMFV